MAFRFSQKNKDTMDFIRAYGSFFTVLTVVLTLCFALDVKNIRFESMSPVMIICIKGLGILVVLAPLVAYHWKKIRLAYLLRRNNLSDFIIEKQEIVLDILNAGRQATYLQKIYFHTFNKKSRDQYIARFRVSGSINRDSTQAVNCNYVFTNLEKNSLMITYFDNTKKPGKDILSKTTGSCSFTLKSGTRLFQKKKAGTWMY